MTLQLAIRALFRLAFIHYEKSITENSLFFGTLLIFFQMRHKLLDSHANVKDLNLLEAKMNFVKAWQSLPDFGVSLFVVRFHGEKKDELLGIAYNRIMRMSLQTGDHIKTWRYNTIKVRNKELESDVNVLLF